MKLKKFISLVLTIATMLSVCALPSVADAASPTVTYKAHVQNRGTLPEVKNGAICGTTGQGLRMEAIWIKISGMSGSIEYNTHIQNRGWDTRYRSNYEMGGSSGQSLRLEAIRIRLKGEIAKYYTVEYSVHVACEGWHGFVGEDQIAGTVGKSRAIEAIRIRLVKKNTSSNNTANTAVSSGSSSYNAKVNEFINKAGFSNGTSWSASQRPKLSSYGSKGCAAYAADFVKYVFGKNSPRGGSAFYNPDEIRAGDVIIVSNSTHWFVVLSRNGNSLRTAEGNWSGKVIVSSSTYSVKNGAILRNGVAFRPLSVGYHFQ